MARHSVESIRNVAFVGHGAVGKTTLADLMLHKAGVNSRAGSVDDGSSLLDTEDDEQERKHSITSAVCHFEHGGKHINIIDAPGYPDFVGTGHRGDAGGGDGRHRRQRSRGHRSQHSQNVRAGRERPAWRE